MSTSLTFSDDIPPPQPRSTRSIERRSVQRQTSFDASATRAPLRRAVRRSKSSYPMPRPLRRNPSTIKKRKSAIEARSVRQVSFELDEKDRVQLSFFFAPSKRSWSEREVEACWYTNADYVKFNKEVLTLTQSLRKDNSLHYEKAIHEVLELCCARDAAEATRLSALTTEKKRSLAVIVAGKARGLQIHTSTMLQQRREDSIKAVLESQGAIRKQKHNSAQQANMIALRYRRVSYYAMHLSRMLASANELIVAPPKPTAATKPATAPKQTSATTA